MITRNRADMPIFLHFVNREASDSMGRIRSEEMDIDILEIMLTSHSSGLSVNISQLLEYCFDRPTLAELLHLLFKEGVLSTTSHDPSLDEFIVARQKMYSHVKSRYPMYFGSDRDLLKFDITKVNAFSMSGLLRRDILDWKPSEFQFLTTRSLDKDRATFWKHLDQVQKAIFCNREVAITKDSIAAVLGIENISKLEVEALGRVFSARYFDHYEIQNMQAAFSGITSSGYIDDLRNFPHYDYIILRKTLILLGWDKLKVTRRGFGVELGKVYGAELHRRFVRCFHVFISMVYSDIISRSNNFSISSDNVSTIRSYFNEAASQLVGPMLVASMEAAPKNIELFYEFGTRILIDACRSGAARSVPMAAYWNLEVDEMRVPKFLILTATVAEEKAVSSVLSDAGFLKSDYFPVGNSFAVRFERVGKYEVINVSSSAGSTGPTGATIVSLDAIRSLKPDYVISAGICFGLKDDKHSLGDILVSERLVDYETVRLGENEFRERGVRVPPAGLLVSAAMRLRAEFDAPGAKVRLGEIISGQKLLDSAASREELKLRFPDAIGGEMEGNGILAASLVEKKDWLLVKAICDWGMGKGDDHHDVAAMNAMRFTLRIMDLVSLAPIKA